MPAELRGDGRMLARRGFASIWKTGSLAKEGACERIEATFARKGVYCEKMESYTACTLVLCEQILSPAAKKASELRVWAKLRGFSVRR